MKNLNVNDSDNSFIVGVSLHLMLGQTTALAPRRERTGSSRVNILRRHKRLLDHVSVHRLRPSTVTRFSRLVEPR